MLSIFFHVPTGHLYVFFGKMSIPIFCPFFDWVIFFFFNMELYELFIYLDINPVLVKLFASIFSYFTGCLFILSMVSFTIQKFLSLSRSHLFISAFLSFA